MHLMEKIMDSVTFRRYGRPERLQPGQEGAEAARELASVRPCTRPSSSSTSGRSTSSAREGREPPLLKRMSELISLLDLTTTLSSGLAGEEILDAALLIVMGELQVARGASSCATRRRVPDAGEARPPAAQPG